MTTPTSMASATAVFRVFSEEASKAPPRKTE